MTTFAPITASHIISSEVLASVIGAEKQKHGGVFTIKAKESGKDYTYKISRSSFKGKWYTHVKVEMGYLNFNRLGSYFNGKVYNKGVVNTPAARGIAWVLSRVESGNFAIVDKHYEVMHTGTCVACGRELTDAISIELGIGPVCGNR